MVLGSSNAVENDKLPTVAVLLATYNGISWIAEQVASILGQTGVNVKLIISDDQSNDGTKEWLLSQASEDRRIIVLPSKSRLGAPGKNFYRLIMEVEITDYDFIALADQDDVWLSNKLSMQIDLASKHAADGVSSNVVAYWQDGSKALIDKAQPIRRLDFLFESAGPGCSFLMTNRLLALVRTILLTNQARAREVELHDWLIYTVCRVSGMRWHIDVRPTLKYRQHGQNAIGVNLGRYAWQKRLRRIVDGWYRGEVSKLARITKSLSQDGYLNNACDIILDPRSMHRLTFLRFINQSRRALSERMLLGLMIAFCVF